MGYKARNSYARLKEAVSLLAQTYRRVDPNERPDLRYICIDPPLRDKAIRNLLNVFESGGNDGDEKEG